MHHKPRHFEINQGCHLRFALFVINVPRSQNAQARRFHSTLHPTVTERITCQGSFEALSIKSLLPADMSGGMCKNANSAEAQPQQV